MGNMPATLPYRRRISVCRAGWRNSASPTPRFWRWDRSYRRPSTFVVPPLRSQTWANPSDQIANVFLGVCASLGHFNFRLIIVPGFITEPQRDLVSKREHLVENRNVCLLGGG